MNRNDSPMKKTAALVLSAFLLLPSVGVRAQVVEVPAPLEAPSAPAAMPALSAAPIAVDASAGLPEAATLDTLSGMAPLAAPLSAARELSRPAPVSAPLTQSLETADREAPRVQTEALRGLAMAAEDKNADPGAVFLSRYDGASPGKSVVEEEAPAVGWLGSIVARLTGRKKAPKPLPLINLDARHVGQYRVPAGRLRKTFEPDSVSGTAGIHIPEGPVKVIGQERAEEALWTALRIEGRETNVVVTGPKGSGRTTLTMQEAEAIAKLKKGVGHDIVSVHDMGDPENLRVLTLEAGQGPEFQARVRTLVANLREALPQIGKLADAEAKKEVEKVVARGDAKIALLKPEVSAVEFEGYPDFAAKLITQKGGGGFALTYKGEVLPKGLEEAVEKEYVTPEQAMELSNLQAEKLGPIQEKLKAIVAEANASIEEIRKQVKGFFQEGVGSFFDQITEDIPEVFKGKGVAEYLSAARTFVVKHAEELAQPEKDSDEEAPRAGNPMVLMLGGGGGAKAMPASRAFGIEVLSTRKSGEGAKVLRVEHPTYENIIGEIAEGPDGRSHVKLGALSTADIVVVDGWDLVQARGVWPIVSQALKNRSVEVSEVRPDMVLMNRKGPINREKVPVTAKLVLIADAQLVALLSHYDPNFAELFGMRAQFDRVMLPKSPEELSDYVSVLARMVKEGGENFLQLANTGVAKLLEYSSFIAGSQRKLTTEFGELRDLIREATLVAREAGAPEIGGEHVAAALKARERRSDLQERKQQEFILDRMMRIDTDGSKVGEINGVAVSSSYESFRAKELLVRHALGLDSAGDWISRAEAQKLAEAFHENNAATHAEAQWGHPMKITATHGVGSPGVVMVDEEVDQVGPIAKEANGTIRGFLLGRFGKNRPLAAKISLKFEQLYGGLEGDSASLAETLVMLSDLSGLPIRQDMIITGSMNQKGQAQVIGGENYKGPGWWKLVKAKGLTGTHGFVLPEGNLDGLHLPEAMVQDVVDGKFHVYGVRDIDEAIEIFFGVKAGKPDADGNYPPDTVNGRVQKEFERLAKVASRSAGG